MPSEWHKDVITNGHLAVGHISIGKTLKHISNSYVWPGMRKHIREFINKCSVCKAFSSRPVRVQMGEMPIPTGPWDVVALDFIGPYPQTVDGYKYLLVILDHYSSWPEVIPAKDQSARTIIDSFSKEILSRYGKPRIVINDNGQGFGSNAWSNFLQEQQVSLHKTTPVHPESNGKLERWNRTFKGALAKLLLNEPSKWYSEFPKVLYNLRHNVVSDVTNRTPYQLMFGRSPGTLPPQLPTVSQPCRTDIGTPEQVQENIRESRRYNLRRTQQRANVDTSLQVGDVVLLKAEEAVTNTSRWDPLWTVMEVWGPVHKIKNNKSGSVKRVHRSKLTKVDPDIEWSDIPDRPRRQFKRR